MEKYNFPRIVNGDTYTGSQFTVNINGSPKDLTSTVITMKIKTESASGTTVKSLAEGSGITKIDAANGVFQVAFDADWGAGRFYYDIQFVDTPVTKTYIYGRIFISEDATDN